MSQLFIFSKTLSTYAGAWVGSVLIMLCSQNVYGEQIKYIDNTDHVDKHGEYFINVLNLALEKSKAQFGDYELIPVALNMRQERALKSVQSGLVDLMWTVTSKQREEEAHAIKIPLLKGLIGHRVLVIKKDNARTFAGLTTLAELGQYTAIQGHDWPDATILENAGLMVERIVWHNSMYKLIASGIVDYFPRSVLEVTQELERFADDSLLIEPKHMIVYPSAIYFFVTKNKKKLAERLEMGLRVAIKDGSFDREFYDFPGHKHAFQHVSFENRTVHRIGNSLMPDTLPLDDKTLWFSVE